MPTLDSIAFDKKRFLKHYWQKTPVVIKAFVPNFNDPLCGDELAGLACEEWVESRIVTFSGGSEEWSLLNGPFTENDFCHFDGGDWTLLVQAVDQWVPEVAELKQKFNFIPSWRIEDIMVSYAEKGGGVGPHFDYYDVFLLQGQGQRHWKLGQQCDHTSELKNTSDLKLLQNFEQSAECILDPGDMLYIPPGLAHWGISCDDSLCYSIGFRSPSEQEMLRGFSEDIATELTESNRYTDPTPELKIQAGEIQVGKLTASHQRLLAAMQDSEKFLRWFGCNATQPRYPELIQPLGDTTVSAEENDNDQRHSPIAELLRKQAMGLFKNPSSRFAYATLDDRCLVFVDGCCYFVSSELLTLAQLLCNSETVVSFADLEEDLLREMRVGFNTGSTTAHSALVLLDSLFLNGSLLMEGE